MSKVKVCSKCKVEKPLDGFFKRKGASDGRRSKCKDCFKLARGKRRDDIILYAREYYKNNIDVLLAKKKEYVKNNKHIIEGYRISFRGKMRVLFLSMRGSSIYRKHPLPNFSFEEFTIWAFENGYKELYDAWEKSGFDTKLSPSPDRLDNSKGYTFNNMQLITWEENNKKK